MHKQDNLFMEIHAIQAMPPSNPNRDDTGSPKTARWGGTERARISSQSWKRATRDLFQQSMRSVRTRRLPELVAATATADGEPDPETMAKAVAVVALAVGGKGKKSEAMKIMEAVLAGAEPVEQQEEEKEEKGGSLFHDESGKLQTIVFASTGEVLRLAEIVSASELAQEKGGHWIDADAEKQALEAMGAVHAADIALFGRFLADNQKNSVDAAVQVAHAIGVNASQIEFDYYTAVEDNPEPGNGGAAHLNTAEFQSSTLYRYAALDMGQLMDNLGDDNGAEAVEVAKAFAQSFIKSCPGGKKSSFAHATLPSAVFVRLTRYQPVNLADAFERAVWQEDGKTTSQVACERLLERAADFEAGYGMPAEKAYFVAIGEHEAEAAWLYHDIEPITFPEMEKELADDLAELIEGEVG